MALSRQEVLQVFCAALAGATARRSLAISPEPGYDQVPPVDAYAASNDAVQVTLAAVNALDCGMVYLPEPEPAPMVGLPPTPPSAG